MGISKAHTDPQFEADLRDLHGKVLALGGVIERQIANATRAFDRRDDDLARRTIDADDESDRLDEEIHELCLKILALHQPTAGDLRLITTTQSITADLERIGDIVVNICERVLELNREAIVEYAVDLPKMADIAEGMVRQSLDAYDRRDIELALSVCREDDIIDAANETFFRNLLSSMVQQPEMISRCLRAMFIAKSVERIADHATNIASMVVFMVTGKSMRHQGKVPREV
jgi:phosphate transport system protein